MASKAKPLNDELKRRFIPFVLAKGFVKQKSTEPHFTEFRRSTPTGEDVFEIQWDKYWRAYFVLNFAKVGANSALWKLKGRLQRKRGGALSCWFGLKPPLLYRLVKCRWSYEPKDVVDELISAFAELEQWWQHGTIGPHMSVW